MAAEGDYNVLAQSSKFNVQLEPGLFKQPYYFQTRTSVSANNNQYKANSSQITLEYEAVSGKGMVPAAVSVDGGKTWEPVVYDKATATAIGRPDLEGKRVLGETAWRSLNTGALKTSTLNSVKDSLRDKGLTPAQVQTTTGIGRATQATTDPNAGNQSGAARTQPTTPGTEVPYVGYKATDAANGGKNAIAKSFGKTLKYPFEMDDRQDKIKFVAVEMEKAALGTKGSGLGAANEGGRAIDFNRFEAPVNSYVKVDEPIFIGIQNGINDQTTVSWGEGSMTAIEAFMFNSSRKVMESSKSFSGELGDIMKDMYDAAGENKSKILDLLAGEAASMQNTLARTQGMVMNPNLELLFQGPQLRPFNFQFKMSARDEDEAKAIKYIIKFFKRHMAPRKEGSIFLKAPHVFTIQYMKGNTAPHPSINLISKSDNEKACALTSFTVDYTPNGSYMTYDDDSGTMVAYTLNLQFMELQPILDTDYETDHLIGY